MIFRNIGLIDDEFKYRADMFVGTIGERIVYIGETAPDEETLDRLSREYSSEILAMNNGCHCCRPDDFDPVFGEGYDGRGRILMPGFYNAHAHSAMTLLRGYGENLPLDRWLNERIFPFEAKLYGDAVYWATLTAMAESMRYGIVSTSDMYFFVDDMIKAISVSGLKSNVSRSVSTMGCDSVDECKGFKEMREAIMMYDGFQNGKILVEACPHSEYTNTDPGIRAIAETAKEFDVRVHVHVAETESETKGCIERYGMTPVEYFESRGIFDQPCNAAHCVWLTDNDRDILAAKKVSVSSNPISNMKLASGICDVPALYAKGINVAIGTDSVASNNSLNFFEEMKMFALAGKVRAMDPAVITPQQVLYSATRAGALAQGREGCGLMKEGFKADLIVVDVDVPNMRPLHDPVNGLVYSADGKDVLLTMVDGEVVYRDGEYKNIDIEKTMAEAEKATQSILAML